MKWFERALYWLALVALAVWVRSIDRGVGTVLAINRSQANIHRMQVDVAYINEARLHVIEGLVVVGGTYLTPDEYDYAVTEHARLLAAEVRLGLEPR